MRTNKKRYTINNLICTKDLHIIQNKNLYNFINRLFNKINLQYNEYINKHLIFNKENFLLNNINKYERMFQYFIKKHNVVIVHWDFSILGNYICNTEDKEYVHKISFSCPNNKEYEWHPDISFQFIKNNNSMIQYYNDFLSLKDKLNNNYINYDNNYITYIKNTSWSITSKILNQIDRHNFPISIGYAIDTKR